MLSIVIITHNEEANLARTLASVKPLNAEIVVVDSHSTDRTLEIAKSFNARVFVEEWKGYAAQKNSAIEKATGDWILSLDADEELDPALVEAMRETLDSLDRVHQLAKESGVHPFMREDASAEIGRFLKGNFGADLAGFWIPRKNHFLGRWIRHGGFWPDPKLRLFRRGAGRFEDRAVHETLRVDGPTAYFRQGALIHHSYPTVSDYIEHMNRYSTLGAEMVVIQGHRVGVTDIALRPIFTFIYNYFFRAGFLDGHEGFLLHVCHAIYVSWKYSKAWELRKQRE